MKSAEYVNLYGETLSLAGLDAEERALVQRLRRRAATQPAWCDFRNDALQAVREFYDRRSRSRQE